eukprot:157724-Prymnesium_polylepis.1
MPDSQPCAARMRRCGTRAPPLAVVHKPARKRRQRQTQEARPLPQTRDRPATPALAAASASPRRNDQEDCRKHCTGGRRRCVGQRVALERRLELQLRVRVSRLPSEALKAIAAPSSPRPRPAMRANSSANVATEHTTLTTSSARVSPIATKSFCSTHTIAAANWPGKRICAYKPACADTSGACDQASVN